VAEHGGYRKPSNPAAVSGPGSLSRRTDGNQPVMSLPNAKYGEQSAFQSAQAGAPLAQAQTPGATTPAPGAGPALTPLDAPTERPNEPVTAGAAVGPGVGPEALGLPNQTSVRNADAERLRKYLPALVMEASDPNAPTGFVNYVRALRAELM
jgi:hypothetical protein